jgi:hypothetical protein
MRGDPAPFQEKFIFIKYSLNNQIYEDTYFEQDNFLSCEIKYDFKNMNCYFDMTNLNNDYNLPLDLLTNIVLNEDLYKFTENFYNSNFVKEDKINIIYIHIDDKNIDRIRVCTIEKDECYIKRMNDDRIDFAKISEKLEEGLEEVEQEKEDVEKEDIEEENIIRDIVKETINDIINNICKQHYKNVLERNYICTIKKHININDKNIVISNTPDNKVIDYLKKNNYKLYFIQDQSNSLNDLNDFLITRFCNNKFVGCLNEVKKTKDYYIRQLLEKNILQLLIDKNNLDVECVYFSSILH